MDACESFLEETEWDWSYSNGKFQVQFRAEHAFHCEEYPVKTATWKACSTNKIEIEWGKYGVYVMDVDMSKQAMSGYDKRFPKEWRKAVFVKRLAPRLLSLFTSVATSSSQTSLMNDEKQKAELIGSAVRKEVQPLSELTTEEQCRVLIEKSEALSMLSEKLKDIPQGEELKQDAAKLMQFVDEIRGNQSVNESVNNMQTFFTAVSKKYSIHTDAMYSETLKLWEEVSKSKEAEGFTQASTDVLDQWKKWGDTEEGKNFMRELSGQLAGTETDVLSYFQTSLHSAASASETAETLKQLISAGGATNVDSLVASLNSLISSASEEVGKAVGERAVGSEGDAASVLVSSGLSFLESARSSQLGQQFLKQGTDLINEHKEFLTSPDLLKQGAKLYQDANARQIFLDQIKDQALKFLLQYLPTAVIPPIKGKKEGYYEYELTEIKLTDFKVDPKDVDVTFDTNGLGLSITANKISCEMNQLKWEVKQLSFPWTSSNGLADATASNCSFQMSLVVAWVLPSQIPIPSVKISVEDPENKQRELTSPRNGRTPKQAEAKPRNSPLSLSRFSLSPSSRTTLSPTSSTQATAPLLSPRAPPSPAAQAIIHVVGAAATKTSNALNEASKNVSIAGEELAQSEAVSKVQVATRGMVNNEDLAAEVARGEALLNAAANVDLKNPASMTEFANAVSLSENLVVNIANNDAVSKTVSVIVSELSKVPEVRQVATEVAQLIRAEPAMNELAAKLTHLAENQAAAKILSELAGVIEEAEDDPVVKEVSQKTVAILDQLSQVSKVSVEQGNVLTKRLSSALAAFNSSQKPMPSLTALNFSTSEPSAQTEVPSSTSQSSSEMAEAKAVTSLSELADAVADVRRKEGESLSETSQLSGKTKVLVDVVTLGKTDIHVIADVATKGFVANRNIMATKFQQLLVELTSISDTVQIISKQLDLNMSTLSVDPLLSNITKSSTPLLSSSAPSSSCLSSTSSSSLSLASTTPASPASPAGSSDFLSALSTMIKASSSPSHSGVLKTTSPCSSARSPTSSVISPSAKAALIQGASDPSATISTLASVISSATNAAAQAANAVAGAAEATEKGEDDDVAIPTLVIGQSGIKLLVADLKIVTQKSRLSKIINPLLNWFKDGVREYVEVALNKALLEEAGTLLQTLNMHAKDHLPMLFKFSTKAGTQIAQAVRESPECQKIVASGGLELAKKKIIERDPRLAAFTEEVARHLDASISTDTATENQSGATSSNVPGDST